MSEKKAFKRLHDLGSVIVDQVDKMLLAGEMPGKIAAWLQADQGVLLDLQPASVKKNLERYRDIELPKKVKQELIPAEKLKPVSKKDLNAMERLKDLADIQEGRLNKLLVKEHTAPLPLTAATNEVRLLKETLVELGKLQLETGVMARVPKTTKGSVFDPISGERKEFIWTEEQEKLSKQLDDIEYEVIEDVAAEV